MNTIPYTIINLNISKELAIENFTKNIQIDMSPDAPMPYLNKETGKFEKLDMQKLRNFSEYNRIDYDNKPFRGYIINNKFYLRHNNHLSNIQIEGTIDGNNSFTTIGYKISTNKFIYIVPIVGIPIAVALGISALISNIYPLLFISIFGILIFTIPIIVHKNKLRKWTENIHALMRDIFK